MKKEKKKAQAGGPDKNKSRERPAPSHLSTCCCTTGCFSPSQSGVNLIVHTLDILMNIREYIVCIYKSWPILQIVMEFIVSSLVLWAPV